LTPASKDGHRRHTRMFFFDLEGEQSFEERVLRKKRLMSTSFMATPAVRFDVSVESAAQTCKLHPSVFVAKVWKEAEVDRTHT